MADFEKHDSEVNMISDILRETSWGMRIGVVLSLLGGLVTIGLFFAHNILGFGSILDLRIAVVLSIGIMLISLFLGFAFGALLDGVFSAIVPEKKKPKRRKRRSRRREEERW